MLKKRIYLPENCEKEECIAYKNFIRSCNFCRISKADRRERVKKRKETHNKAALKFYHKNKSQKGAHG